MPSRSEEFQRPVYALRDPLRLLCICRTEPSWTGLALQLDRFGCTEPRFRWCSTQSTGAGALREEAFDMVLLGDPAEGDTDPLVFLQALREGGLDEPVLIVSSRTDDSWLLRCAEMNADVLAAAEGWNSRSLAIWMARVFERTEQSRELQRLLLADRRSRSDGREETNLVIRQLQQISAAAGPGEDVVDAPRDLRRRYAELLRTYVFFGCGRLDAELQRTAQAIQASQLPAASVLRMHCDCLGTLLSGCGSRSIRHLQQNADLLALEILMRLADAYRRQTGFRGLGDYGIDLLHGDTLRQKDLDE